MNAPWNNVQEKFAYFTKLEQQRSSNNYTGDIYKNVTFHFPKHESSKGDGD